MATALKSKPASKAAIEPITDDPEFAAANDLLSALVAQLRDVQCKIKIAELLPWADRGSKTSQENIRYQLRRLRNEAGAVPPRPAVPAIDRAISLIFGERAPDPIPDDDIEQARADAVTLDEAIRTQSAVVYDLRDRKSYEIAVSLVAANAELTLSFYRAAQDLARARDAKDRLHRDFVAAGYIDRSDIIPNLNLGGAYAIGDESNASSQLAALRSILETRGIL